MDQGSVPELPEVEALAALLRENAVGPVVTRVDLAAVRAVAAAVEHSAREAPGATGQLTAAPG